ncbi:MAG TPA: protease inhibitor I42 family protein [Hyphomonadaceae bacterium]|jgi:predicted secreted protein
MFIRTLAAVAGFGLLAAGCQPVVTSPEEKPVADQPADPATPDAFANAVNFDCDGGGKLDVVFEGGGPPTALIRLDGGAPQKLAIDENATSGMIYKDAATTMDFGGDRLQLITGGATKACTFISRAVPAPTVEGAVRNLTEADSNASVEIKVGEKMTVSLSGVPTAGYVWTADAPPAFVKVSEGPGGATSTSQFLPGFAGGNHWEVLIIEGVAAGEGEITLVQKRPWEEKSSPDDQRFTFRLKVN